MEGNLMNKKNSKSSLGKIITLVLILIIPGLLHFYLRRTGENVYKPLPYLGLSGKDSITQVQPFQLINENNEPVSFPNGSSITIVNFMHTDCDAFGDLMNLAMVKVAKKFGKHPMVDLYSISLDSNDSPEVLKKFYNKYKVSDTKWHLLTGDQKETSRIAREEFRIDGFQDTLSNNKIIHSPFFVLLDSKQQIRGYYEFFTKDEVDRLIGEVILLITEESRNKKTVP